METLNFDMPEKPGQPDPLAQPEQPESEGCLGEIGWHAASFVLPCASLTFYRQATRRKTGSAVLFFMLFMAIISVLTTAGLYVNLTTISTQIRAAFAAGKMPEITISKGVALVRGRQPAVLIDNANMLVVIDTTGSYTYIDSNRYKEGFLLTSTELVILSSSRQEQRLPLAQLNTTLQQDPIVINAETASNMWQNFSASFSLIALVLLLLWNMGVRMLYLLVLAAMVRGLVAWLHSKQTLGFILTLGIYAFVPTQYLVYLLQRMGISFIFLQTLILLAVWAMAAYAALVEHGWDLLGPSRPLRAWRALIGLPLLVVLAVDVIFTLPNGGPIDLIASAVIGIIMVGVGMFTLPRGAEDNEQAGPGMGVS